MNAFRFQSPLLLLFLIPVIAICFFMGRKRRFAVLYSSVEYVRSLPITFRQRVRRTLPWLRALGLVLIVFSLARPQLGREETRIHTEGVAIQMCIDKSGSMQAMDFMLDKERVNRLDAVKDVFRKFVTGGDDFYGRQDDLVGLIAFGGFASALCPPTLDHGALLEVLAAVQIPKPIEDEQGHVLNARLLQEEQATAIGDALALAVDRLKNVTSKTRIVVLLSDGENTAGVVSPEEAAAAAKEFGIKVYSIGVGANGMAPFPFVDRYDRIVLSPQPVRLDEATLKLIASETGGEYFNAKDMESLKAVCEQIDKLEKTEIEGRLYTEYREVFVYSLATGLACILLAEILAATWLRGLP